MKKKFALLLVSVLIISACAFSLAACDKEPVDEFEQYNMAKYLTTYTYKRVQVEQKINGRFQDCSDQHFISEQINDWDFMMSYTDTPDRICNQIYLALQDCLEKIGRTITIERERTIFSGSIGEFPSEMISHQTIGHMGLKLDTTAQVATDIPFDAEEEIMVEWYGRKISDQPVYDHDEAVCTIIYTDPVEIDAEIYRFCIVHSYNITKGQ